MIDFDDIVEEEYNGNDKIALMYNFNRYYICTRINKIQIYIYKQGVYTNETIQKVDKEIVKKELIYDKSNNIIINNDYYANIDQLRNIQGYENIKIIGYDLTKEEYLNNDKYIETGKVNNDYFNIKLL